MPMYVIILHLYDSYYVYYSLLWKYYPYNNVSTVLTLYYKTLNECPLLLFSVTPRSRVMPYNLIVAQIVKKCMEHEGSLP
jgi:hypothetical protein